MELNDRSDVDVYFPDGTFCHSEGETDYFCRKHRCLSSARGGRYEVVPDLDVNGNARPDGKLSVPSDAEAYFSLDSNVMRVAALYLSLILGLDFRENPRVTISTRWTTMRFLTLSGR